MPKLGLLGLKTGAFLLDNGLLQSWLHEHATWNSEYEAVPESLGTTMNVQVMVNWLQECSYLLGGNKSKEESRGS